jgi:hypothetical protein
MAGRAAHVHFGQFNLSPFPNFSSSYLQFVRIVPRPHSTHEMMHVAMQLLVIAKDRSDQLIFKKNPIRAWVLVLISTSLSHKTLIKEIKSKFGFMRQSVFAKNIKVLSK